MADELLRSKHVFGNRANLEAAIETGKVDSFDILFLYDENDKPIIGWLNKAGEPVFLEDESRECVVEVDELPESGEAGKVYIYGEDGYFWDGQKFVNLCKPTDVTELEASIKALESLVAKNAEEAKSYADEKAAEILDNVEHSYEKVKYEVSDTPAGTLVNYSEREIRIMCPKDAVFTKQNVGTGGNPNSYYMTFKTYYPNKDVVGYMEHLGDLSDSEILTKSSTDKYGRVYQTTWLALADYDASTDSWTYRGKESSKDDYYGYDYGIDWYDANGVMIASDSIRINLSNEECHSVIEPYYVQNVAKEVDEKIENVAYSSKVYTDEQIQTIMNMFTIVEI